MTANKRKQVGFSLVEVLVASAVFLVAFVSLTGLVGMSVVRRSGASKQASMSRLAGEEYQKYASQGYDALSAPGGSYDRTDPDGRKATFTVTVNNDCNDGALPPNGFQAKPLDATQACCPNGRCCKALLVNMAWVDTSRPNKPTVNETYSGFVTKSCP